jgi:hypothetical protein
VLGTFDDADREVGGERGSVGGEGAVADERGAVREELSGSGGFRGWVAGGEGEEKREGRKRERTGVTRDRAGGFQSTIQKRFEVIVQSVGPAGSS